MSNTDILAQGEPPPANTSTAHHNVIAVSSNAGSPTHISTRGEPERRPGSPTAAAAAAAEGWRCKLYQLNAQGQWTDKGTGTLSIKNDERLGGAAFHAVNESDGSLLLNCRIVMDDIYHKQGDNIITWIEPPSHGKEPYDFALSFQDEQGCRQIWDKLTTVQGRVPSDYRTLEAMDSVLETTEEIKELPAASIPALPEICEMTSAASPAQRDQYVRNLLDEDAKYLHQLMDLFHDCQELEDVQSMRRVARCMKNIVLLNDLHLCEFLLTKHNFLQLLTILEYDTDLREKANYRHFLTKEARFHQILPIEEPRLVDKIEQTFFLILLRDYVLRPTMDETNLSALSSMIFFNSTFILDHFYKESKYLEQLFGLLARLQASAVPGGLLNGDLGEESGRDSEGGSGEETQELQSKIERRERIWQFLRELMSLSKDTQPSNQVIFYRFLADEVPFFQSFVPTLADPQASVKERMCCSEILATFCINDPGHFRRFVAFFAHHPPKPTEVQAGAAGEQFRVEGCRSLLFWIIQRLISDRDTGVLIHLSEALLSALDVDTMEGQARDRFLGLFYDHYVIWLTEPFAHLQYSHTKTPTSPASSKSPVGSPSVQQSRHQHHNHHHHHPARPHHGLASSRETDPQTFAASLGHVCDILTYSVRAHAYRMRYFVILNNLAHKVLRLTHAPEKFLRLAAIRFIRAILAQKDDFYNRHLVKNNVMAPILHLFVDNGVQATNLIHSAIIELVDFIRIENLKGLIEHIVEKHQDLVQELSTSIPTFRALIMKYERMKEFELRPLSAGLEAEEEERGMVGRGRKRTMAESDEEAYFNEEDEEEEREGQKAAPMEGITIANDIFARSPEAEATSPPPSPPPLRLVNYDDDDEDDEELDRFWSGKKGGAVPSRESGGGDGSSRGGQRAPMPAGSGVGKGVAMQGRRGSIGNGIRFGGAAPGRVGFGGRGSLNTSGRRREEEDDRGLEDTAR